MKPNFESPVRTARDLVERNITLFTHSRSWTDKMLQSHIPEYRQIGETSVELNSVVTEFEFIRNELLREAFIKTKNHGTIQNQSKK